MILTFANGNTVEVTDISTITGLNIEAISYSQLDAILANFTPENMKRVTLGETVYTGIIPQNVTINHNFGETKITAYVVCREKTNEEIMSEQITELQEAVVEIAGGM